MRLFAGIMFRNIGIDWVLSVQETYLFAHRVLTARICLASDDHIPFVLYKFGPQLHKRSKIAD
ncbi:BQ5605_C137g13409 [Microbotryum silenes-dioicae]|uniref:BQ5605_C137g13409 protein n=1 Tax=Microbotryum silenes-dioicae TaxID=796604 RepID=A0A2X0N820_9BASI|nr:BQ5605_C137g13409 [Microbotryum silenes-dioicae]